MEGTKVINQKTMPYNKESGYGRAVLDGVYSDGNTTGKHFIVCGATSPNYDRTSQIFKADPDGKLRLFNTIALALAQTVAGRGDFIFLDASYTTAPTAADITLAETNGVTIIPMGGQFTDGSMVLSRATATLPQTTAADIFTVTGKILLLQILGEVTTVIQTQANNTKLIAKSGANSTDLCAVTDISAHAVGSLYSITGTVANAMVYTAATANALLAQASPLILRGGSIQLSCAASNTGSVKWKVRYLPLEPGAKVIAA